MTNKQRLQTILDGNVPDAPPHFELVFQIEKEMFGADHKVVEDADYATGKDRFDALDVFGFDIMHKLIDELGWAAVPAVGYPVDGVDYIKAITKTKKEVGDKALVFTFNGDGVFWMPTGDGFMDFVVMMFEQPKKMHEIARKKCDVAIEIAKQQVDAGVDFIVQNSDFGFNKGPFISPEHFKEFVTPYMTEITQAIHDLGVPTILHSDGDLNLLLEQIYSTGVDGYQSIDPQGGMDIKQVREKYPDWILMGNVNCSMLQETDEQQIRSSVQECMKHGGVGKRYIFSTSNCIFDGMPVESYRTMLDEYNKIVARHIKS